MARTRLLSRARKGNETTLYEQKAQHRAFPRGPPPQYYPGSDLLNFADCSDRGSGEPGRLIWPALSLKEEKQFDMTSPSLFRTPLSLCRPFRLGRLVIKTCPLTVLILSVLTLVLLGPVRRPSRRCSAAMSRRTLALLCCLTSRTLASLVTPTLHRPALLRRPRVAAASVRCAEGDDEKSIVERLGLPVNLISENSNPYVTSKADRMREKFGEQSVVGQSARSGGREGVEARLEEDIARFKVRLETDLTLSLSLSLASATASVSASPPPSRCKAERGPDPSELTADQEPGFLMKTIDTLGTILTFNFGIICLFFTWFLVCHTGLEPRASRLRARPQPTRHSAPVHRDRSATHTREPRLGQVGVGAQFGADNVTIINAFRSCWDFLILPLLSTHMALTFLSFGLEKAVNAGDPA